METVYAQVLMRLTFRGMKPADAVRAVHTQLTRTGRVMLLPRIARAYEKMAQRSKGRDSVVLTVARAGDRAAAERDIAGILTSLKVAAADLVHRVDETLIGGWRLEGKELLVDASFKKQLLALYNRTTQS